MRSAFPFLLSAFLAAASANSTARPVFAVGVGYGLGSDARLYDGSNIAAPPPVDVTSFVAFTGGVRVAVADVNGDGQADLIVGAGPGGAPTVSIFDGRTGVLLDQYNAFSASFTGGVYVAAADVDGVGHADVIVGADTGGAPEVRVFSGKDHSVLLDFFAFAPTFTGGVRVAAGDVNGDGHAGADATGGFFPLWRLAAGRVCRRPSTGRRDLRRRLRGVRAWQVPIVADSHAFTGRLRKLTRSPKYVAG
ncbi:MAG TPA: VCBS repeat-containing protein [Burkholderiales bacterium]|nr:VCBS repeat-containing protein [Burkholderiales bacterium]